MASYGQPRRLNAVTVFMLLCVAAGAYWMWRFFPVYFDGWTVDHELHEAASACYKLSHLNDSEKSKQLKALVDKTRADIVQQAHVTDPDLAVNLDIDGDTATLSADYSVVVTHPFIDKTTTLHFHKVDTADIKRVNWN